MGGIYEFQPGDVTISPAANLSITYADSAVVGIPENQIQLFHWDAQSNTWQPVRAQFDPAHNVVIASVTGLGTYALGYDTEPPAIAVLSPANGSVVSEAQPLISALISDDGAGVDAATIHMQLDGQTVAATYDIGTGELIYLPAAGLSPGSHRVTIVAWDVLSNQSSLTTTFTIGDLAKLYVPLIQRR